MKRAELKGCNMTSAQSVVLADNDICVHLFINFDSSVTFKG